MWLFLKDLLHRGWQEALANGSSTRISVFLLGFGVLALGFIFTAGIEWLTGDRNMAALIAALKSWKSWLGAAMALFVAWVCLFVYSTINVAYHDHQKLLAAEAKNCPQVRSEMERDSDSSVTAQKEKKHRSLPPSAAPTVSAPGGVAIGRDNNGNATVNNYNRTEITYPYDGSFKKTFSGGTMNIIALSAPNTPNPEYTKIQTELKAGDSQGALVDAQKLIAPEPMWATPHILAALADINLGNQDAAKAEDQEARELVPSGYEFEKDYAPHFDHLEEAIKRHEPTK